MDLPKVRHGDTATHDPNPGSLGSGSDALVIERLQCFASSFALSYSSSRCMTEYLVIDSGGWRARIVFVQKIQRCPTEVVLEWRWVCQEEQRLAV